MIKELYNMIEQETNLLTPNKKLESRILLSLDKLSPCRKSKKSFDSFQRYCWSKNPVIWLNKRYTWPHPTKSGSLRCYLPLTNTLIQKIYEINWFFPEILMIKKSCSLTGKEAQLATPNQKWQSHNSTLIQMPYGHTTFLKLGIGWLSDTQNLTWQRLRV